MAYVKTNWVNGTTPVNSTNMNKIENGIADVETSTTALANTKAPIDSPTFTGTVSGISKSMVGLGNVDNTSDANKPVSSATQTALNAKANLSGGNAFTGAQTIDGNRVSRDIGFMTVLLQTTAWISDTRFTGFNYRATITDADCELNDHIDIKIRERLTFQDINIAIQAGISFNYYDSYTGEIRIYSVSVPGAAVSLKYRINK